MIWRRTGWIALGFMAGVVIARRLKRPLRSLAVTTTRGAFNLSDRIKATGETIAEGWGNLMTEASEELEVRHTKEHHSPAKKKKGNTKAKAETIESWSKNDQPEPEGDI
jgi:hypothetical protein